MFVATVRFGLARTSGVRYAVAGELPDYNLITAKMYDERDNILRPLLSTIPANRPIPIALFVAFISLY